MRSAVTHGKFRSTSAPAVTAQFDIGEQIRQAVGDIRGLRLGPAEILVGSFIRKTIRTPGGVELHVATQTQNEDRFQGSVGLVLALGAGTFEDDATHKFHGFKAEIGEWVIYHCADGFEKKIRDQHCRFIQDVHIRSVTNDPSIVL